VRVPDFSVMPVGSLHAYYKLYLYVKPNNLAPGWNRNRIIDTLVGEGVPCYQGSCSEVYLEKAFDGTGWRPPSRLPVAQELGETSLMLLVHPTLTSEEVHKTGLALDKVLASASLSVENCE
jgi:dTDP-4-amino-4,6-dideoxygalactose transaminase